MVNIVLNNSFFLDQRMMVSDDFSFYYHMLFLPMHKRNIKMEFIGITKYAPSIQWLLKIKIYINMYINRKREREWKHIGQNPNIGSLNFIVWNPKFQYTHP